MVGEALAGSEPAPIGVSKAHAGAMDPRMAAMGGRPGAGRRPSVVPTNLPPAQVALAGRTQSPHIISHLFGLPKFGQYRREREEKEREKHASIAYGQTERPVTELPASVVYGKEQPLTPECATSRGRTNSGTTLLASERLLGTRVTLAERRAWRREPGRRRRSFRTDQQGSWTGLSDCNERPVFFLRARASDSFEIEDGSGRWTHTSFIVFSARRKARARPSLDSRQSRRASWTQSKG